MKGWNALVVNALPMAGKKKKRQMFPNVSQTDFMTSAGRKMPCGSGGFKEMARFYKKDPTARVGSSQGWAGKQRKSNFQAAQSAAMEIKRADR